MAELGTHADRGEAALGGEAHLDGWQEMAMQHHRARVRAFLSVTAALAVVLSGNAPGFAQQQASKDFTATPLAPQSTHSVGAAKSNGSDKVSVVVVLDDASLASYSGGVTPCRSRKLK